MHHELSITTIVDILILHAKQADKEVFKKVKLGTLSRAIEYGTIKVASHRRSGHTSAILVLAGVNSLVFTGNSRHISHLKECGCLGTCRSLRAKLRSKRDVDYIFIDNATYCRQSDIKKLYNVNFLRECFGDRLPIIIHLG